MAADNWRLTQSDEALILHTCCKFIAHMHANLTHAQLVYLNVNDNEEAILSLSH